MTVYTTPAPDRDNPFVALGVLAAAALIATLSARDYAGAWNDGSRLATVECLVDYHTLAIDRSVFVEPVPPGQPSPYPANDEVLRNGTADKLLIDGRFYSDKSPVPAVILAGAYQGLQGLTGLTARAQPNRFCYAMTLASSGLAYVVAVMCIYLLGRPLRLPLALRLLLTASFALATVALPYARHVNNHILLLAVTAALMLALAHAAEDALAGRINWPRLAVLGTLAGLGYTIDLGAGPPLLVCTLAWSLYRWRRLAPVAACAVAALPWLILHHALNYAVGGTIKPANAVAEYFQWPGCPFNPHNMTGAWNHSIGHFFTYAAALLAGKRGFLGHNLPLFLAAAGLVVLVRRRTLEWPEVVFAGCWSGGTYLAYALTSNNYSGMCCSIRWFVPLLAPAYYVLGVFLRQYPRYQADLLILSGWGAVCAGFMWWHGPWMQHMVPFFWPIQGAAFVSWAACRHRWRRRELAQALPVAEPTRLADAA